MGDGTAPTLYRATVQGAKMTLAFTEQLDTNAEPAPGAFTVTRNGEAVSFRPYSLTTNGRPKPVLQDPVPVSMIGASVILTLSAPVGDGDAVTVSYEAPGSGSRLRDLAGNAVADFTGEAVTNETPDTTGPTLESASVDGAALTLTFDEALDTTAAPAADAFAVSVAENGASVQSVAFDASDATRVVLTLGAAVAHGESGITVDYTEAAEHPLRDAAGNKVASFAGEPAANATADATVPGFASAEVSGAALTLTFDEALDAGSAPAGSAFTVTAAPAGGEARAIAGTGAASVEGAVVTVTLVEPVLVGETVTVAYTPPAGADASPLRDAAGNEAAAFAGEAVTNGTAAAPAVVSAGVVSDPGADGAYARGETVEAAVTFDRAVAVDTEGGTPTLALVADGTIRRAGFVSGSGTERLVFAYRAVEADGTLRAVRVAASGLKPGGGAIAGAADGTPAQLGFGEAPGVTAVSIADEPDGRWEAGDTVEAELRFAEPVAVEGAPWVTFVMGSAVMRGGLRRRLGVGRADLPLHARRRRRGVDPRGAGEQHPGRGRRVDPERGRRARGGARAPAGAAHARAAAGSVAVGERGGGGLGRRKRRHLCAGRRDFASG